MYKHLLKKKINDYYKHNQREKCFLNFKDIHSILVLFDTKEYEQADDLIEKLKKVNKQVTAYAYQNKNDGYDYSETPYRMVTEKEAGNLFDNKMDEIAEEVEGQTFDAVFDLTIDRNIPLEYLLARAKARVKAGLKKNDLPHYDLAILDPNEGKGSLTVKELGKQIIYYLHTIQTQ